MLFFDFFDDKTFGLFTLGAFLFLMFSTIYAFKIRQRVGLLYFLGAFLLICITSLLQAHTEYFYAKAVSVKVLTLVEMLMVLTSSLLLITSASYILINKPLSLGLRFSFISLGILIFIYTIFIANNADIVGNIRQILPIIGMSYVFLSFISLPKFWNRLGVVLAAISVAGFIILMLLPIFYDKKYPWFITLILILTMGLSYILMYNEHLKSELIKTKNEQKATALNIKNIIKSSPFPIILSRLGDDTLIMANNNALKLFNLNESDIYRYHFKDFFVDGENRKLLTERLEQNREVHDFEILVKTLTGNTPFWLLLSANVIDYNNDVVLYAAFQDITSRKRQEFALQSQADRDPLTSIYNRRYFEKNVAEKIKEAHKKRNPFAVFMIDADKFKNINDTYGHKTGDKVLIELASVCERSLRQEDVVARYGGEEFVIFVDNVDQSTAVMVANRLRKTIADSIVYSDDKVPVSFSVSIGVAPSGISDNVSVMIKMADDAMYLAKQNGRNRVEVYSKEQIEKIKLQETNSNTNQIHPAFLSEEIKEISLLDGVENSILED